MDLKVYKFAELTNRSLTTPCAIVGKNGAGKSSMFNAYLWCLTGRNKDGQEMGEAVYSVKDQAEERFASVEVTIEGIKFKRNCRPVYMRKRGTNEQTLKSLCSTTYYINDVEVLMADYQAEVAKLSNGRSFQLFSDINYFANLPKDAQTSIFMEMLKVDRDQYFAGMRDITLIKRDIAEIRRQMKSKEEWLEQERRNLAAIEEPVEYADKIKELKEKINALQEQRPTLTAEQIAENNEIGRQIAELERLQLKLFFAPTDKADELKREKAKFNELLNERNNMTRRKINRDNDLENAKKRLVELESNSEFDEQCETYTHIFKQIGDYEARIAADTAYIADYEQHVKEASCGVCPQCTDIFCEFRKTDIEPKADILARIEQYENKIGALRANANELKENHERTVNGTIEAQKKYIAELEAQTFEPNIDLEKIVVKIERLEADVEIEERANKEALDKFNADKAARENEILKLRAKIHVAQAATTDNKIYMLRVELTDLEKKQRKADEVRGHRKGLSDSIFQCTGELSALTLKLADLEAEQIDYEKADEQYRADIMKKANEVLPEGMSVNLFRRLVTGDGYENIFELYYNGKRYKNTALVIKGNFELTRMFQQQFNVNLPIFVDDLANIVDDEFIPKGGDIVQIVAAPGMDLEIMKLF